MANVIKIKQSAEADNEPTTSQIVQGELALNTADKRLFSSDGTSIFEIGAEPKHLNTKEVTETMTYISGATVTPDLDNGTLFRTSGNITVLAVPTVEAGKSFTLFKHATHTLAFSSTYQWSGNLTPTPEATYREIYTFICDGSYWYGMVAGRRML